jgi:hypothetical protein
LPSTTPRSWPGSPAQRPATQDAGLGQPGAAARRGDPGRRRQLT